MLGEAKNAGFSSDMVLQQAPAKAAIYGFGEGPEFDGPM